MTTAVCPWCENLRWTEEKRQGKPVELTYSGFCSAACRDEAGHEYELYLDKFNDYMAGYPVTFEKIKRKPKKQEES